MFAGGSEHLTIWTARSVFKSVAGSEGACDWEWGRVLMVAVECVADSGECITGSGGVCNWEWWSVWQGVWKCVAGSGGMCGRELVCRWYVVGECVAGSGGVW